MMQVFDQTIVVQQPFVQHDEHRSSSAIENTQKNLPQINKDLFLYLCYFLKTSTTWKVSVFGVTLIHIFPHLDWRRYSVSLRIQSECGKYGAE